MSPSLWISQDYFPATAPPRPSFPDEPKFLDSLPDVSQFLCLMFPDFFAWCFPIFCRMLPDFFTLNVSRLPDVPWFLFLMYPNFLAWCFPISLLDIYQCLCRISVFLFPVDPYISCPCSFYNSNCESEIFTSKLISTQFSLLLFIWNFEQITVPQCWLCCWVTTLCRRRGGLLGKIWSSVTISYERHNVVTRYDNLRKGNVVTAMSSCAELTGQLQPSGDPATVASCWQTILVCQNISTDWNQTISCLTLHHLVSTWSTWYAGRGDGHSKQTLNPRPWDNGGGGLNWFPLLVYLCIWAPWKRAE